MTKSDFRTAMIICTVALGLGLLAGILAAHHYPNPGFLKGWIRFDQLRPLHTGFILCWIIFGAFAIAARAMQEDSGMAFRGFRGKFRNFLMAGALVLMAGAYLTRTFGGREYWEFPVWMAIPYLLLGLLQLSIAFPLRKSISKAPVYHWMWLTGSLMFVLILIENYSWLIPGIFNKPIKDLTLQWKAAGALVGAWNQLIYGTSIWLMAKMSKTQKVPAPGSAMAMFFLGFTNLLFNWGHHIYTLPTAPWIRYISYIISMTEWVLLLNIMRVWIKSDGKSVVRLTWAGKFLRAADRWVFFNLLLALLMSIPALNLFTHGTHITVAHSMGSTIGINSMILMAAFFHFSSENRNTGSSYLKTAFVVMQASLAIFWLSLIGSGIIRGLWQLQPGHAGFGEMTRKSLPFFITFFWSGSMLALSFIPFIGALWRKKPR